MRTLRSRFLAGATIVAASAVVVAAMTTDATAAVAVPRPMDVMVGGRSMHIVCTGPVDGSRPTVVFEAGYGGSSVEFADVIGRLAARDAPACAYDRAGLGKSDPPPRPMTVVDGVEDLHALLAAADVRPPYVLAGHSIGGWHVRLFTARYPDEVGGVVFIDSSHPDQDARAAAVRPPERTDEHPGLAMARNDTIGHSVPSAEGGWLDMAASVESVRNSGDLGDRPLVVLTATHHDLGLPAPYEDRFEVAWLELQTELASLSTNGRQQTVEGAGHYIHVERPEVVADAVAEVVAATDPSETAS